METPPVYRIELLGTVGGQEYVFAQENVLTSAGSTVTGRYSLTGGSSRYYSCQLNTMLRVEDGVFTLKLPNLFSMTTHDNQTLSLSDVQIRQVSVTADSTSTRYAASDAAEREFS